MKRGADISGTALLDFAGNLVSNDASVWWTTAAGEQKYENKKTDYAFTWYENRYSRAAIDAALQAYGWTWVPAQFMWRKQDGSWATAKDVRKALEALFPTHFTPQATYGKPKITTGLSI